MLIRRLVYIILILVILFIALSTVCVADDGSTTWPRSLWPIVLSWLAPIGLGLLACGAVPPVRATAVVRVGWLAVGIATISYWLYGFAFQFGGVGFFLDHPELAGLVRKWMWIPPGMAWGGGGVIGLEGMLLHGAASTPTAMLLFFAQLPWLTTAIAIPLWSLQGRTGPVALLLIGILSATIYAVLGGWTWGGGWLTALPLGHGFVDFWGVGAVHLAGAASALAGMLAFGVRSWRPRTVTVDDLADGEATFVPMPPLHLPILATLGTWLCALGWIGWGLSTPLMLASAPRVSTIEMMIGLWLAVSGGALAAGAFSWLTTGRANTLMVSRGVLGALIAAGAGVPFMPFWSALVVGAVAGLLAPLVHYAVEQWLRLDDPTAVIAAHGVPAVWGLLAVGLFADGRAGQGWNHVGASAYRGVAGQGVTGYWAATGYSGDWPAQFQSQMVGVAAIALAAFFLSWLLFAAIQVSSKAWSGGYAIRLPKAAPANADSGPKPARLRRLWAGLKALFRRRAVPPPEDREPESDGR